MKSLRLLVLILPVFMTGCRASEPAAAATTTPAAPKAHMNMLQLMRAFPFPHSNVLFDTQTRDPIGPEKKQSMVYSVYRWQDSDTYAGWEGVENSALALAEMAPLLLTPRKCANGLQAPVDQPDWKAAVEGLVSAGEAGHKAALTKNLDEMLNVSETVVNACSSCHDKYRDVDLSGGTRCQVAAPARTAKK
ncbi:MAG TPA: hypothetical protein VIR54_01815 [Vicinamibacterales bacterium]|jgi:hypothetical protein